MYTVLLLFMSSPESKALFQERNSENEFTTYRNLLSKTIEPISTKKMATKQPCV